MEFDNATDLDRKSGVRGPKKTGPSPFHRSSQFDDVGKTILNRPAATRFRKTRSYHQGFQLGPISSRSIVSLAHGALPL
jgi:hypothetical protein